MTINILTFCKENNYGANLQCYALKCVLEKEGHVVSVTNFSLHHSNLHIIARVINFIQSFYFNRFRKKYLNCFTKKIKYDEELYTSPPIADLYIVGSDQVWNYSIEGNAKPELFFFSFLPDEKPRI